MGPGRALERLSREECINYIERHPARVERIALAGARPVIFPVNCAIDGDGVVFRTDPGSKFHAAVHKAFVLLRSTGSSRTGRLAGASWCGDGRSSSRMPTNSSD